MNKQKKLSVLTVLMVTLGALTSCQNQSSPVSSKASSIASTASSQKVSSVGSSSAASSSKTVSSSSTAPSSSQEASSVSVRDKLSVTPLTGKTTVFEAEEAVLNNCNATNQGNLKDPSNGWVVGGLGVPDASLTFTINSTVAEKVTLETVMQHPNDDYFSDIYEVTLNGTKIDTKDIWTPSNPTDADFFYDVWNVFPFANVDFVAGANVLVFKTVANKSANFDCLKVIAPTSELTWTPTYNYGVKPVEGTEFKFEGESAVLDGCTAKGGSDYSSASGSAIVTDLSWGAGKSMTFNITSDKAETVTLETVMVFKETVSFSDLFTATFNGTVLDTSKVQANPEDPWYNWATTVFANVDLIAGANTLVLTTSGDKANNFDYLKVIAPTAALTWTNGPTDNLSTIKVLDGTAYTFEAEEATIAGGAEVKVKDDDNNYGNCSGTGVVGGLNVAGASLTFTITSDKAEKVTLETCMIHDEDADLFSKLYKVELNGNEIDTSNIKSPIGDHWYDWVLLPVANIDLEIGDNVLTLTTVGTLASNFDYIKLVAPTAKLAWGVKANPAVITPVEGVKYKFEGENATLDGGCSALKKDADNNYGDCSGTGVVGGLDSPNESMTFNINSDISEIVTLQTCMVHKEDANFEDLYTVTLNGTNVNVKGVKAPASDPWYDWAVLSFANIKLAVGKNTIVLTTASDQNSNFDYLQIIAPTATLSWAE